LIYHSIFEKLVQDKHTVTVFTGQPNYNDVSYKKQPAYTNLNGVNIIRVPLLPERKKIKWLRFLNFTIYSMLAMIHVFKNRNYDLIIVYSYPPFITPGVVRYIKKILKIPYIYHCADIQPESSIAAETLPDNWFQEILIKVETKNCLDANVVVTLSTDMSNILLEKGLRKENISIINNFMPKIYGDGNILPSQLIERKENDFLILFAGNLGNFQGLDKIIEAAKILKENIQIKFIFMGAGLAKDALLQQSSELLGKTVFFIQSQPLNTAFAMMEYSDIGMISLKQDIYKYAYPSKTMVYLAAGCPLIALVESESELAGEIINKNLGYVCPQNDPLKIAEIINRAWKERNDWSDKREEIKKTAEELFGRDAAVDKWSKIIKNLPL
jgi:glycosyltransferase involved in cell wall biosynthesis